MFSQLLLSDNYAGSKACVLWKYCLKKMISVHSHKQHLILQGLYALVEFSSKDSITALKENCAIPSTQHETSVPFKSRLLSLKWTGAGNQTGSNSLKCHEQAPLPINELIQHLSKQQSVSYLWKDFEIPFECSLPFKPNPWSTTSS